VKLQELLSSATQRLVHASDTPRLDAEILLAFVLDKSRTFLFAWPESEINTDLSREFENLLQQRLTGKPIAHITGVREFWSLSLRVTTDTLIPRPETELLVETLLELLPEDESLHIADLGTGSGAIALALAHERPNWKIVATDQSTAALDVARDNAQQLKICNVAFVQGEWFTPLAGRKFHAIVSNPPYIAENDKHLSQGDVRFEPMSALASGVDGLKDIQFIARQAKEYLLPDGLLMVEHGFDQKQAVQKIFQRAGFAHIQQRDDLNGHPRLTLGFKTN
jgi:release factor glutamine methyltransferase